MADQVNHPSHYNKIPIECIEVVKHFDFIRGNAIKYIWRSGEKGKELEDLKKARWYIDYAIREIENNENHKA